MPNVRSTETPLTVRLIDAGTFFEEAVKRTPSPVAQPLLPFRSTVVPIVLMPRTSYMLLAVTFYVNTFVGETGSQERTLIPRDTVRDRVVLVVPSRSPLTFQSRPSGAKAEQRSRSALLSLTTV